MTKKLRYLCMLLLLVVASAAWGEDETITFSSLYSSNTVLDGKIINGTNCSITFNKREGGTATQYYTNGTAVRWYGGGTLQIASRTKTIEKIEITYTQTANSVSANTGTYSLSNSVGTWTGSAESVTFTQSGTTGQCRISSIAVTYASSATACANPTFTPAAGTYTSPKSVTISTTTGGATIYYTTNGNEPTTSSSVYSAPIEVTSTTTLKAIAVKSGMGNSDVATALYTIVNIEHAGTQADPYTVADARNAIDANTGITGVYATGVVSAIPYPYTSNNGITFNIVDNSGDADFLQAFKCTGDNADKVQIGDIVVVSGNLTKYNSTYEFGQGCALISLTPSTSRQDPGLNFSAATAEADLADLSSFTAPTFSNPHELNVTFSSSKPEVAAVASDGTVSILSEGTTVISATSEETEAFFAGAASYTLTVTNTNKILVTVDEKGNTIFDLSDNAWKFPVGIKTTGTKTYTNNGYTLTFYGPTGEGFYFDASSSYVLLGKQNATLSLPAFKYNVSKIEVYGDEGGSGNVTQNIFVGNKAVSTQTTGCKEMKTYEIATAYQEADNVYTLKVTNGNNTRISKIIVYKAKDLVTLAFTGVPEMITKGEKATYSATATPSVEGITYSSSNESVVMVEETTGEITALAVGTATITATFAGNDNYQPATASYEIEVVGAPHTAKFFVNGKEQTEAEILVREGVGITFPADPADIAGKTFVGWTTTAITGNTDEKPDLVTSATMGTADVMYYAVFATKTAGDANQVIDVLNRTTTGVTATSYTTWSGKTDKSDAVYAGQSAGGNESIQLRSNNNNSGVITTSSGGKLKKVAVEWNSNTSSGRTLNVYGSNVAYTAASDLYGDKAGTLLGTIVKGTSTELEVDGNYDFVGLRSDDGAMYLTSISITWENGTPDTYSGYCTTVVAPVVPAAPIVFHDSGEYEGTLSIPMFAQEGATIKYTVNGGDEQTYSTPVELSTGETTIKAWAVKDGVASDVTEPKTFTIKEKAKGAVVEDGYYTIQNNEGKYVNVAGRKTVTLVSDTKSAGTVIRVKAEEDGVKVLRSQAVDLPRYAERAMSYVPELVKELMKRLSENVENPIIGEDGANLITDEVMDLDYNLYLEEADGGYRIYGKTPSMQRVVDFYATNKTIIDERLPRLEEFVEDVLLKVAERLDHPNSEWAKKFKVHDIWALIVNEENKLTEPVDEASTAKFFTEVLSSEANIWNFAHETAMIYWDKVKSYLNDNISELGDYGKYIEKIPHIRPNFKYYIVPSASGVDIISEGNSEIKNASTAWTLDKRTGFDVTFDATLSKNNGKEMYKTLYVDFAYELPENENVKALKVTDVTEAGVAVTEEITGVVPAQTPVLLMSTDVENLTKTLSLSTADGAAVTDNLLVGADYLINKYEINTPQMESIFTLLANLSQSLADKYEYLKRKNAGTVNNKYFFGLTADDLNLCTYKNEKNEDDCIVRSLSMGDEKLGFYNNWTANANEAFLVSEKSNPILLTLKGDVYRDGVIDNKDLTALVEIVLGKVTLENKPENYDFDAAHVNDDTEINIADVTALVNILK